MKHLKTYSELRELSTLFESFSSENKLFESEGEIRDYLNDILMDIQDKGLYCYLITDDDIKVGISRFDLNVHSGNREPFTITSDIFSTLEHINSYLEEQNYKISSIIFQAKDKDGQLQNDGSDDLEDFKKILRTWGYYAFDSLVLKYKNQK